MSGRDQSTKPIGSPPPVCTTGDEERPRRGATLGRRFTMSGSHIRSSQIRADEIVTRQSDMDKEALSRVAAFFEILNRINEREQVC